MIRNTFVLLPSVGAKKERAIWESGVRTWDDFVSSESVCTMKPQAKERNDIILTQAMELMDDGECGALADMTPRSEHWRLFGDFREGAKYLDIETDGLSRDALVTLVTVHSPKETVTLTEGIDLSPETLADALDGTEILVTFNGSCFDVPVLRNSFPEVDLDIPQFDLRFASRKVGYRGGLKPLEMDLGIRREEDIDGMDGADAVRLWHAWARHDDRDSLDTLTEYNRADTVNLERIADVIYGRLVREHAGFVW
ncbi:ribonuclease H-like domain-containing protein [Candidatus Methanoprimaticola sp. MG2]|uniref:ribonuclease H-like domain-containing protein n=1 Tax=Candidatus Methanoprimaticola sp. MG2 TaxID=3228838 RepID=UPI0039C73689